MARRPAAPAFQPYVLVGSHEMVKLHRLVVAPSFGAVICLYHPLVVPGVTYGVCDAAILDCFLPEGVAPRYAPSERPLQSLLAELRQAVRDHGASPEAVRHLINLGALDEGDIIVAGKKLATKGAEAAAATTEAAKPAGKGKGNAEALKKAREAKAADSGPDTRKIKVLKKDNPYRDGSGRAASFDALKGAKTAQDYKDAGGKAKYLARWAEEGIIELN